MGTTDGHRFSVYRNNIAVGLIGALEARYPGSRRFAGEELFRAMARAFVHSHKPRSPVMIAYGEEFPEFVVEWEGTDPRLVDLARLENAWVEAYHAADAAAATSETLPLSVLIVCRRRGSPFTPPHGSCASPRPPPQFGPRLRTRTIRSRLQKGTAKTR